MHNIYREPLFGTQFARQKFFPILHFFVFLRLLNKGTQFARQKFFPILHFFVFLRLLRRNSNQITRNIHQIRQILLF